MNQDTKRKLDKWVSKEYEWLVGEISTNIAWGRMSEYALDLTHHILSDLYKVKDEQLDDMLETGKIKGWLLRAAALQLKSQTSPFWHIWRKHKYSARSGVIDSDTGETNTPSYEMEVEPKEELSDCMNRAVSQLHWYHRELWNKKFVEARSFQELYEYYNISKRHLIKDLNLAINEVREVCKDAETIN